MTARSDGALPCDGSSAPSEGSDYRGRMFDACCTQDPQVLVETVSDLLDMPVTILDVDFNVIAKFPTVLQGDEQWDAESVGGKTDFVYIKRIMDDDVYEAYAKTNKPIVVDWGSYRDAPRLTSLVKYKGVEVGYFVALARGREITSRDIDVAAAAVSMFGCFMQADFVCGTSSMSRQSVLFSSVLHGEIVDEGDYREAVGSLEVSLKPPFALMEVGVAQLHHVPLGSILTKRIIKEFESCVHAAVDGRVYILAGSVKLEDFTTIAKRYAASLKAEGMVLSVSRFYDDLCLLDDMRWQVDKMIGLGPSVEPRKSIFFFDDFTFDVVLDAIVRNIPADTLKSPSLGHVKEYDGRNGTRYLETISAYYASGMDKKKTAEALSVHPNTVKYRLESINRLFGIDVASDKFAPVQLAIEERIEKMKEPNSS